MATSPIIVRPGPHLVPKPHPASRSNPLALWHLLSLDAPTVAALWTAFVAHANHVPLPASSLTAMAIAVWLLYAADRLLDSRLPETAASAHQPLEPRHHFHRRHQLAFRIGIAIATLALASLLPTLPTEAIKLYLVEGCFLAGYFVFIHATHSAHRLPKELAVGLFFAAATFIPTISRVPALRLPLLAPAILFAVLCSINCLFIYAWEHPSPTPSDTHVATRLALRYLQPLTFTLLVLSAATAISPQPAAHQIGAAIGLATLLLLLLNRYRRFFAATTLRAAADLALLTPLLILLVSR